MKKNLILICIDGCRSDRAQKSKIFTDYLPGTIFCSQSITYAPYTNSSMFAVFSGTNGNRNGCFSYWHSLKFRDTKFKTITKYLHDENYETYADIHSKLAIPLNDFDQCNIYDESNTDLISRHTKLISDMSQISKNNKNFFLYLHYEKIHTEIMNSVLKKYTNFSEEYFENKSENKIRYDNLFNNSELYLRKILDTVNENNLLDDSLILIISDHGISLGEKFGERAYGAFCYDYTIKTFGILISSQFKNKTITQQVRHIDFLPTILDHLGLPIDKNYEKFDGQSLIPLFFEKTLPEKIAYTETANPLKDNAPPKIPNTKSVRTSKWKLIFNEYNNTKELYNLIQDPNEENNLIGNSLDIENELWIELNKLDVL
jgi:membrane-anchored protein YejM (alkaline phosphatase superfamily)